MTDLVGRWAIDTKRRIVVDVNAIIPDSIPMLYVVSKDDNYYITPAENIIPYDKYWFDKNPE